MQLARVVSTSEAVGATRSRKRKIAALAACIEELGPEEMEIGVAFLTGELRQGKIGVGWAAVRDAAPDSVSLEASLTLTEVDRALAAIAELQGRGSAAERLRLLGELLARGTAAEQTFLSRLLVGELRQGALEGVLLDAVAAASGVRAAAVRRAAMLGGGLRAVALAALTRGETGLAAFRLELFRPLQPMLAQTAEHVADALAPVSRGLRVQARRGTSAGAS